MARLIVCSACERHVLTEDSGCPHCGASLRSPGAVGKTAGALLMGLSLAGCPASDDTSETIGNGESSTSAASGSSGSTDASAGSGVGATTDPNSTDPAYGNPDSDTFGTTDMTASDGSTGTEGTGTTGGTGGSSSSGGSSSGSSSTSG